MPENSGEHGPWRRIEELLEQLIATVGGAPGQDPVQLELMNLIGTIAQIQSDQNTQFQVLKAHTDEIIALLKAGHGPTESVGVIYAPPTPQT